MAKQTEFVPNWYEDTTPEKSYRSLFKWGNKSEFKHPNRRLYALVKKTFHMTDADFQTPQMMGLENVEFQIPPALEQGHIDYFRSLLGYENFAMDDYNRLRCAYGAGALDALRMRQKIIENLPDVVLYPRTQDDVLAIVQYCDRYRLPVNIRGGGSTVTRGYESLTGGVAIDLARQLTRVLDFNEIDQTITVEAGMFGPALEDLLNHAKERLGAQHNYTLGHFPQSFEYSSVGGWIVTRGAGQNSTYYGKIEDLVLSQTYIMPQGVYKTPAYPRCALGPDMNQVMMGGEGTFGVLTDATLKLSRYQPENTRYYAFIFHAWQDGIHAMREIMQGEFGRPSVFRLSDAEETDVGLKLYGIEGTVADTLITGFGYEPLKRCLMLGSTDGDADATRLVRKKISRICRQHKAFDLSAFGVAQHWEASRFRDPYLREDLQDYGILTDTLECAVRWSQVEQVHDQVRAFIKNRPNTICTCHISHVYPQGCNLYFIFIAKIATINEYLDLQYGVLTEFLKSGAGISHHHGIGKQGGSWFVEQAGEFNLEVIKAIKNVIDPNGILNPGGTLGLDMNEAQTARRWGYRETPE